nr:uncharacterized protein LOC113474143 [Ciona intestinalis]|eukprot:XP_026689750.1 uncharacterized protein LOC113474143 [Ciona intestinalis]
MLHGKGRSRGCTICLTSTAFVFFFTFYALYRYTLINVDDVMLKNIDFDYDDYGIDVSGLRNFDDVTREKESEIEKWDREMKKEKGIRMGYVTDNCDIPTRVFGIIYLTKNNRGGLKVVVQVNYTAERQINKGEGEAVIMAMFGRAKALNQTLELCSVDEELTDCPIKKGFRHYKREVILPKFAPKGRYHGTVSLRYSDTKETKLCAKGRMII